MKLELKYNNSRSGGAIFDDEVKFSNYIIKDVPDWESIWIFSSKCIEKGTLEQQKFYYDEFKPSILDDKAIKLGRNENYGFIFLLELLDDFNDGKINSETLVKTLNLLNESYPFFREDALKCLVNYYELTGDWHKSWETISKYQKDIRRYEYVFNHNLRDYYLYSKKLNKDLITIDNIFDFFSFNPLTEFGQRNQSEILKHYDLILKNEIKKLEKNSFWDVFIKNDVPFKIYSKKYYKKILEPNKDYEITDRLLDIWSMDKSIHRRFPIIVESSIRSFIQTVLKECENKYRESLGLNLIGDEEPIWKSESNLYELIKSEFKDEEIIHQASPLWLEPQSFDIFFPRKNIAIEYQGVQHYKAIDVFGGEDGLKKRQELDLQKKKLAKENDCTLIYVDKGYNFEEVSRTIKRELDARLDIYVKKEFIDLKVPVKLEPEKISSKQVFDCKTEKTLSFDELNKKYNYSLNINLLKKQDSLYGRYVLQDKVEKSKTVKRWRNIVDLKTGEINRHSMKSFASMVETTENSVWGFFNGRQKVFNKRYKLYLNSSQNELF